MNLDKVLAKSAEYFFLSGADDEHDEEEMLELLDGINWNALRQAILLEGRPVYEYVAGGTANGRMNYRSHDLFGRKAVRLDEDVIFPDGQDGDNLVNSYSLELWLLEDFSFVVTSCYRMKIGKNTYRSEYRTVKSFDWKKTDMEVDFCCVADAMENLCTRIEAHGYPMIEV